MTTLMDILSMSVVQIILVAYIGALLGEMKKEVDDDDAIVFSKFVVSWLSSGFGGVMVGMILQGTVAKDNNYLVLGGSGVAGFAGNQTSISIATKILELFAAGETAKTHKSKKKKN